MNFVVKGYVMKTGFKATHDFVCIDHKFEIGQTYELKGKPIPCHYGFHYCVNPKDVLEYYPIQHNFRLLEIEDLGDSITDDNKSVTNKIRIVREIPKEEYYQLFGIVKVQNGKGYTAISPSEAKHLVEAAKIYCQRVKAELYGV
jgi:hypothetical protein